MFACEHFGIQPDMIILSKSLGAGLPIGAVIADADKFPDLEPGMHSGSMHCSPLSCAAALANLPLLEKHCFSSLKRGKYALSRFEEMKTKSFLILSAMFAEKGCLSVLNFLKRWKGIK